MKTTKNIETNSAKAWMLAARPKTLTGAAMPVMVGTAWAVAHTRGQINVLPVVLCFLFAFIMQIDANFVNDYFDFVKGNDDKRRLGPRRTCSQGWITPRAMKRALFATTPLACLAGLPLVWYGGWWTIITGAVCVLFCFLYTTSLSYRAMGDVLVVVFFGIVPVCATYWLAIPLPQTLSAEVIVASVACGIVTDALLIVNNYRDMQNDKRVGKNTLAVLLGESRTRGLYLLTGCAACAMGIVFALSSHLFAFLLPLAYLPLHVATYKALVRINRGKALNRVLGKTARNLFVYGLLLTVGLLLDTFA